MKAIVSFVLCLMACNSMFAQDSLALTVKPLIKDASYSGGGMEDLYYYINNNFNYNNVKKEDVPETLKKQPYFLFYVVFAVSEDGKAFEFAPKEINADNTFYKEAVRVIASTRWNPALIDNEYKKQFLVVPIKAIISDF